MLFFPSVYKCRINSGYLKSMWNKTDCTFSPTLAFEMHQRRDEGDNPAI